MKFKAEISNSRFNELCKIVATGQVKDLRNNFNYMLFLNSEIELLLLETPMSEENKRIAKLKFIHCLTDEAIADRLQLDKRTVIKRKKLISECLINTCYKLFIK